MKSLKVLLFVMFAFSIVVSVDAKSFAKGKPDGHEADAYAILPFQKSAKLTDWLETIHKTIDFPYNTYFEGLRDAPHQDFSWGKYGHRLFFHWGFNGNPWSMPLQEMVNRCHWNESTVASFKRKIVDEQARRNRLVMESTAQTLNFGMSGKQRDYSNAFASLVYDVHLLGDYSTTKTAMLQEVNLVIDDIKVALFNKLQGGEAAKSINRRLDESKARYKDPVVRAERVLQILKSELPSFLLSCQDGFFKRHFQKSGIKLKS